MIALVDYGMGNLRSVSQALAHVARDLDLCVVVSANPEAVYAAEQAKAQQGGDIVKRNAIEEALTLLPERAQVEDVSLSGGFAG